MCIRDSFYSDKPHRSDYKKRIRVLDNKNQETCSAYPFRWIDHTKFNIHSVCHDPDFGGKCENGNTIQEKFKAGMELMLSNETELNQVWVDTFFNLKLLVDDVSVFDSADYLKVEDGKLISESDRIEVKYIDEYTILVTYYADIEISKAWTKVETNEASLLAKGDDYFAFKTSHPFIKGEFSLTLPETLEITNYSWDNSVNWDFDFNKDADPRHISAETFKCVFPRLLMYIRWGSS